MREESVAAQMCMLNNELAMTVFTSVNAKSPNKRPPPRHVLMLLYHQTLNVNVAVGSQAPSLSLLLQQKQNHAQSNHVQAPPQQQQEHPDRDRGAYTEYAHYNGRQTYGQISRPPQRQHLYQ
jgi:hypothetical protein